MTRKAALVVAPGRGTYNKEELGYLGRLHGDKKSFIGMIDGKRKSLGQIPVSDLDSSDKYSVSKFTRGDNASPLIYACAYADFQSVNRDDFDIVAITGNSMGWYIALACAGALDAEGGFDVVNTMGTLMQETLIGGQLIYPFVDGNWREIPGKRAELLALIEEVPGLSLSIDLGGMIVFAGEASALDAAEKRLPRVQDRYPMRLQNHAAFHTVLQEPVSREGKAKLPQDLFRQPETPLIDGRGTIWFPHATEISAIWDYTLGHQVVQPYDFTRAIQVGMREFAPEAVIILGPGRTLGGAVAQALIGIGWHGLSSKEDFTELQRRNPLVLAMGIDDQRKAVVKGVAGQKSAAPS